MKIKKLFKYLPIAMMAAGLAVAATTPFLSLLNNSDYLKNQIFNVDQAVNETEYTDQLEYIRNDVAKQTGVTNSVASIKLSDNSSSLSNSSAALVTKTDGSTLLYMWGQNGFGQLGNGTRTTTSTPKLVDSTLFGSKKIVQIALGYSYSAALLEDDSLYAWGQNNFGQLGNGTKNDTSTPTPVDSTKFDGKKIVQIALGYIHSAAFVTETDGSTLLYMWGGNNQGQLGNGTTDNATTPTLVDATNFGGKKIFQIALGNGHSAALLEDDSLYMWGRNNYGQLGNGTNNDTSTPAPVDSAPFGANKITQIAVGEFHSAVLVTETDGSTLLYMWGLDTDGQLGNGGGSNKSTPVQVDSTPFGSKKITQIALGRSHSASLLEDGSLYMWGLNNYGQLGNGSTTNTSTPTPVALSGKKITKIALGMNYSAAFATETDDSTLLYMWGNNSSGQLGFTANGTPNPTPTWMSQLGAPSNITAESTLTAQEAVDNIWVDDKFNLTGFKNSFNLTNIPETTDQEITMDTKPTYDNVTGTVTMTVKIKYFYNEDGLLVPDTAAEEMTINGFVPAAAEDQNPATDNQDPFPWWWIIIGIGGAAIIGVGIWFVIKKRKEAEAKSTDGEPDSKDPKDDEKKTSESEAKSEEAAKTDNHPIDKTDEETKTEEASKPKSLKKTKK